MPASPRMTSTLLRPSRAPASSRSIVEVSVPRPISINRCYCALGSALVRRPSSARLTPLLELNLPGGVILDAVVDRLAGDPGHEREQDPDADQHVEDGEEL